VSATNRGAPRHALDRYETPAWCVAALLRETDIRDHTWILDPCCASGAILHTIRGLTQVRCFGVDIEPSYNGESHRGDWLNDRRFAKIPPGTLIVSNPPYRQAADFIRVAISRTTPAWWLLRLNFLGSDRSRIGLWPHLSRVLVLCPRPSFTGGGTDACEYAWMRFDPARVSECTLGWARK
jgi:hypothetical protein